MLRKQRKLQPWRRFGYVILIIIKSGELLLWFSPRIINGLRSYIKHSKGCFIRYPNTLKLVKKKLGCASFSQPLLGVWISDETLFLVFDILLHIHDFRIFAINVGPLSVPWAKLRKSKPLVRIKDIILANLYRNSKYSLSTGFNRG